MELLGAIAIIAIIMVVAFPAAMAIRNNLRTMELNKKAQAVYSQVQSRLTSLQTDGSLNELESALGATRELSSPPTSPAAYQYADGETTDWSKYGMYVLSSTLGPDGTIINKYLVTDDTSMGASATLTGSYIIEMSPSTAEVYAVYYWEGDVLGSTDYNTVSALSSDLLTSNHIGYYGGKSIDPAIAHKNVTLFNDLGFSIVNKEELYARVFSSDFSKAAFDPSKLSVTITATGTGYYGSGSGTWSKTFTGGDTSTGFAINATTNEVDIILDSMRSGLDFETITKQAICPGTDIKVSISVTYDGTTYDASNRSGMQDKTANSLFESLDKSTKTVSISAVRHLNNLNVSWAGGQYYSYLNLTEFHKMSQTTDIDFDGTNWASDAVSIQSRDKGVTVTNRNPKSSMPAIVLDSAINTSKYASVNSYDGGSHKLKNFVIDNSTWSSGLFSSLYGSFSNVFMTDASVTGSGGHTGGLVGTLYLGAMTNCHNDVTSVDNLASESSVGVSGGSSYLGGLVGSFESPGAITNCSATANVTNRYGSSYTGGLVGQMPNAACTLSGCSVGNALADPTTDVIETVEGGYSTGGLVGLFSGTSVDGCTALANVSSSSTCAGGLIGRADNPYAKITNCTVGSGVTDPSVDTISSVTAINDYVGGLVGRCYGVGISGCSVLANVNASGHSFVGGLIGANENTSAVIDSCSTGLGIVNPSVDTISRVTGGAYTGGLVGYCHASTVSNSSTLCDVYGNGDVGGLLGRAADYATISNCTAGMGIDSPGHDTISYVVGTANYVGGLLGRSWVASVSGCSTLNDVSADGSYVGGIVGASENAAAEYSNCKIGDGIVDPTHDTVEAITGDTCVGGLGGYFNASSVQGCSAVANIAANGSNAGGLVGFAATNGVTMSDSRVGVGGNALLVVTGGQFSGGFIGRLPGYGTITGCEVLCTSVKSSSTSVGGFIGEQGSGVITDCHAIGNPDYDNAEGGRPAIIATGYAGGFAGRLYNCTTSGCYADASVRAAGGSLVGGFIGVADNGSISSCYSSGDASGTTEIGGFAGYVGYASVSDSFATSNVWGSVRTGGFVGYVVSAAAGFTNDISYGQVRDANGYLPSGASTIGGFVGLDSNRSDSGNLSNCAYLLMSGYNDGLSNTATAAYQPTGKAYSALQVSSSTETHAYKATLKGQTFPFAMVGGLPYYGDWPASAYHIKFVDHAGAVLYETDVAPGVTPTYDKTAAGVPSPYKSDNRIYVWNRTWVASDTGAAGIVPATSDATYVAQYVSIPFGTDLIAGGTSIWSSSLLWGSSGYFSKNGNVSAYTTSPFSSSAKAYAENGDHSVDSEAPYSSTGNQANASTSVRNQLANAGYPTDAVDNTNGTFSWRIVVYKNTIVTVPSGMESYIGYNTGTKSYEGGFVVLCGEKIPNASSITAAQASASYLVYEYDVGRAKSGQAAYRVGTVKITNVNPLNGKTLAYYVYNTSTFVDSTGWITL